MKKYVTKRSTRDFIDTETGEITSQLVEVEYKQVIKPSKFSMMYKDERIYDLKKISDIKVFLALCDLAVYNTGEFHMNIKQRRVLAKRAKVSHLNMSKNLNRLIEMGLLAEDGGTYYINPQVAWTGESRERDRVLNDIEFMNKFKKPLKEDIKEDGEAPDFTALQSRIDKASDEGNDDGRREIFI